VYGSALARVSRDPIRRDPACPLCGAQPTITALLNYEEFCGLDAAALVASAA
jgi:adenylyltransferase/sulfurtransferase